MPSPLKQIHTATFTGGMNSDLAPEHMPPNVYRYMLNCNVMSSEDGDVGVVTNVKGTRLVNFQLPSGRNKCIGVVADEEAGNLYYALYNGNGFHGWYRYNMTDNAVVRVIQCKTDTEDVDIFGWRETDLILHGVVVANNLLYWTISNRRDVARKINVAKAMDKEGGYGPFIREEWTRAYKSPPFNAPVASYNTDYSKKFNRLFGYQFQFAYRYIYDDKEYGETSDHSNVANPDEEYFTGTKGVPEKNNVIDVVIETGDDIVDSIEILMRRTNTDGSFSPWMSVTILNKLNEGIASGDNYTYRFYNDGAYLPVDQYRVLRNNSSLPRSPYCMDYAKNALVYANYVDGRPPVDLDVSIGVRYEDLYIDDSTEDSMNSPFIQFNESSRGWTPQSWLGGSGYRWIVGSLLIGDDVKPGNVFTMYAQMSQGIRLVFSYTAGYSDTNRTVAAYFYNRFKASNFFSEDYGKPGGYVNPVDIDGAGNAVVSFRMMSTRGEPYWTITTNNGNPVNVVSLKDTGQSIRNIKNGSSIKYGLVYSDQDGRKELVQTSDEMIVPIMTMNELGGIKKPVISLSIRHSPPIWAKSMSVVRTGDLTRDSFLYMLIQKALLIDTGSDKYYDLVVGSIFTYQQIHPNTVIRYEFKKGDRVAVRYKNSGSSFTVAEKSTDFEVISYQERTEEDVTDEVTVLGTNVVNTSSATSDNVGNYININGAERLIIGAVDGVSYSLDNNYPVDGSESKFPSYKIINKRGVLRIKQDPDFPFDDFDIVEVYTPSAANSEGGDLIFREFGMSFPIIDWGTPAARHSGNVSDQSGASPAVIEISRGSSYVRNREFPTANNTKNPSVLVAVIEDANYSDFYASAMTDDGKVNAQDRGFGEVVLGSRFIHSSTFIEGTEINGLSDFDAANARDFNDKYGDVRKIIFEDGRMYVLKELKATWMPIYGVIISDEANTDMLASSSNFFPKNLQYFAWDGGVGDNPESVVRMGTQFFFVSVNSGIIARIGGNGVDPISKIYDLDSEVRSILEVARKSSLRVIGSGDVERDEYNITIPDYVDTVYTTVFNGNEWQADDDFEPEVGPTVNAGVDQNINSGATTLVGVVTAGSKPVSQTMWVQVSGPSGATITSPQNTTTTVTGLVEGVYVFRLTAMDQGGMSAFDEVQVSVSVATSVYMGVLDSFRTPTIGEITGGTAVPYVGSGDIEYPVEEIDMGPSYIFLAWPTSSGTKTMWKDKFSVLNSGSIGGSGNLFFDIQTVGNYYVVTTSYRTEFENPIILW